MNVKFGKDIGNTSSAHDSRHSSLSQRRTYMSKFQAFRTMYRVIGRGEVIKSSLTSGLESSSTKKKNKKPSALSKIAGVFLPTKSKDGKKSATSGGSKRLLNRVFVVILAIYAMAIFGAIGYKLPSPNLVSLFNIVVLLALFMTAMFGVLSGITKLYYTQDLKYYLSLPINGSVIMWAKLLRHVSGMLVMEALPLVLWLGSAVNTHASVVTIVQAIVAYFISVVILNIMLMVVIIPIMRFTNFAHNQDRFMRVSGVLFVLFAMLLGVLSQFFFGANADRSQEQISQTLNVVGGISQNVAARVIFSVICPAIPLSHYIFNANLLRSLLALLVLLAVLAVYFVIVAIFAHAWYFESVRKMQGSTGVRSTRVFNKRQLSKKVASNSAVKAHTLETFKIANRTPAFFTNLVLSNLLMPVYFVVIAGVVFFTQASKIPGSFVDKIRFLHTFGSSVTFGSLPLSALLLGAMGLVFISSTSSYYAMIAISADGRDFFYMKAMPIRWGSYLLGKFAVSCIQNVVVFIFVLAGTIFFGLPVLSIVLVLLTYVLVSCSALVIALIAGAYTTNFDWTDETALVKGGNSLMRSFGGMLTSLLVAVLPAATIIVQLVGLWSWLSMPLAQSIALIMLIVETVALFAILLGPTVAKLEKIES